MATKGVCFSRLLKCLRSLYGKQCGPRSGTVCSGSTLFASILNLSVMLGNYLQQTTSADTFSDAFFLGALRVRTQNSLILYFSGGNARFETPIKFTMYTYKMGRVPEDPFCWSGVLTQERK